MRLSIVGLCLALISASSIAAAESAHDFRRRAHQIMFTHDLDMRDIEAEVRFGRDVAARILGRFQLADHAALLRYVNKVGQALALHTNRPELAFHFGVVESDTANAYSTPGGYVFITTGALEHMRNEAELAAVLAHEIAHINHRHIVDRLNIKAEDNSMMSGFTLMVGGTSETARVAFHQAVDEAVAILFDKGFSIRDELESDRTATLLLATAGYDPMALHRYLQRVESAEDETKAGTTHPPSAQRFGALTQLIKEEQLGDLGYPSRRKRFVNHVETK